MQKTNEIAESFSLAQSKLVVQTSDLPLGALAEMVESQAIDLQPGFQRRERWSIEKQSALIESFLLNVPVPPIYLAEEADGTYTAIDGKQRLRAISDYMNNKFALRNLDQISKAEGVYFDQLPREIINAFKLRPFLRVVLLLKHTDPLLKYEVFLRLNRGGESLNPQEIRNVAFRGRLNSKIYELSENIFLKQQLKIDSNKSTSYRDMADAEYVLRFLTLQERIEQFSGKLSREMDDFMRRWQHANPDKIDGFGKLFSSSIARCQSLWKENAFRRPDGDGWRGQTLAGMYDAQMLSVAQLSNGILKRAIDNSERVVAGTRDLFGDPDFEQSVRTGTNTPNRIRYRVKKMKELLESI